MGFLIPVSGVRVPSGVPIDEKGVSFVIQPVKFETQEDLFRFSELASKEDFPIYISTSYGQLDARSLLGLFTILGKDVNIVVGDYANADKFSAFLQKYANS